MTLNTLNTPVIVATSVRLYGIPNCDTVKKARTWLADQGLEAVFWDFKKQGVPAAELATWANALGWEPLVNRKGTTWRKLDAATLQAVVDAASAMQLMQSQPSVIKRPVVCWPDGSVSVGFDAGVWAQRVAGKA
jgi:Spx/MgsR family transcriptional regulator